MANPRTNPTKTTRVSDTANRQSQASPGPTPPESPRDPDAIRIVPMERGRETTRQPLGTKKAPASKLTYRGGPLMTSCDVVSIFWGAAWNAGTLKTLQGQLSKFFTFVMTSPLIDQLAEYSVPGQAIAHGTFHGAVSVTDHAPGATVSDSAVRAFLQQQLAANAQLPKPTANRLYFIYLPPGTAVVQGGGKSCTAFCGYHDAIVDAVHGNIYYAVMPYPGCTGCRGTLSVVDALTSTSSHELCEAITDPVPGQGWYDDVHGEIGDICAWKTKKLGAYTVQLEWSNRSARCI